MMTFQWKLHLKWSVTRYLMATKSVVIAWGRAAGAKRFWPGWFAGCANIQPVVFLSSIHSHDAGNTYASYEALSFTGYPLSITPVTGQLPGREH